MGESKLWEAFFSWMDGWMVDMRFYVLFNRISVVYQGYERVIMKGCVQGNCLRLKRFWPQEIKFGTIRETEIFIHPKKRGGNFFVDKIHFPTLFVKKL